MNDEKLTQAQLEKIITQLKDEDRCFTDYSEEFEEGINTSYSYNKEKKQFECTRTDVSVGGFYEVTAYSEEEMKSVLSAYSSKDFIKRNFRL